MGNVREDAGKYGISGASPGSNVQGGGVVGNIVRQQEMGGDGGYAQGSGGVPPPGGATDHEGDSKTWIRQIVVVPFGSVGNRRCRDTHHRGVPKET